MIPLILAGMGIVLCLALMTYIAYRVINYEWLQWSLTGLVVSLPFEQIPSLDIAGGTIRISQLLVMASLFLILVLIIQQNEKIIGAKLNFLFFGSLIFFVASIPSWFFVEDFRRFFITIIPTVLVFLGAIEISMFLEKPIRAFKWLLVSLFFACVFGAYQFVGDLAGLPEELTFLNERYTKAIFGFPRIHSTAIEPLYFAGMLFLPIFTFLAYWVSHRRPINIPRVPTSIINVSLIIFFSVFFIATISKSAIGILGLMVTAVILIWFFKYPHIRTISDVVSLGLSGVIGLYLIIILFPSFNTWVTVIADHVIDTISGDAASIQERGIFLSTALQLLPDHAILGIGSGQYGVMGSHLLRFLSQQEKGRFFIVNNVYLEVLLEFGIFALTAFVVLIARTLYRGALGLYQSNDWTESKSLHIFILTATLVAYFLQWLTFSPIYIMPIFILIGLLVNLTDKNHSGSLE